MIVELSVIHQPAHEFGREHWSAESNQILINTNCRELTGEPVQFLADTREAVIAQVISYLQSKGLHGRLRIV
jgi:hypothetical protein